ncbi:heavy-metal-associated domain-containing protein [Nocardioides taihuensis]|jgi:copper chaperone|uniref:Heavy-metal-associated domain-containing protein n=1 Tax=Nocardioides taihuensis TaxID=1835606 RepID=A0ABW0BCW0_9ACTN
MSTSTYTVVGMTCSHCAMSVTEEITAIPGVENVDVDLASGQVTVSSGSDLDRSQVQEAVEEAGYQLAAS